MVCLSVPNLAAINGDMGFEFGSRLLWFVAKTLSELFDGSLLFRTWEAEFVCFLPDVTQEVFQLRVSRLPGDLDAALSAADAHRHSLGRGRICR